MAAPVTAASAPAPTAAAAKPEVEANAQSKAQVQAQAPAPAARAFDVFDAPDPLDAFDAFDAFDPFHPPATAASDALFAWPFATAATLAPPLQPSGSFALPWRPPRSAMALSVPVWSAAGAAQAQSHANGVLAPKLALDLIELPGRYVVNADLPGVQSGDIDIRVDRHTGIIRVAVVRRRVANCDCNFVSAARAAPSAPATGSATASATASAGASAGATASEAKNTGATGASAAVSACDGACAAKAVHCRDCEAKGETMAHAPPTVPLVTGCCGFCAGALRLKGQPKCGRGARCDAYAAADADAALYRRSERQFGRAERSFRVPADADTAAVTSSLRGGVLSISVPRVRPQTGPNGAAKNGEHKADAKSSAEAASQHRAVANAAAAVAGSADLRARVLTHHVTAPDAGDGNPTVRHERVMRQAVAAAADPVRRAALLRHHMLRADPLDAWQYHSPFSAYQSVLRDAMVLARDFDVVSQHVLARPPYDTADTNPILRHERAMRQAVGVAQAHAARADAHRAAADAQLALAAAAHAAATEEAANVAAANAAALSL